MKIVSTREEFLIALDSHLPRNCVGAEIGVYRGEFSNDILRIINPQTLVLIDPYETGGKEYGESLNHLRTAYSTNEDYQFVAQRFSGNERAELNRKYSFDAVGDYPNNHFDFIYHDASHLYEEFKKDLNDWLPKLRADGVMCGHDYIEIDNFGVVQAVNEFIEEHGARMIIFNQNGGDWALKK